MLGWRRAHKGELPIVTQQPLTAEAWELARFWINGDQSLVVTGVEEKWSPELIGALLLECARTAAISYARTGLMPEGEAWERILKGMDDERASLNDLDLVH